MRTRNRQQGVALVITLIFLSVITVMAVAFLALTQRGRDSENESGNRIVADQMADMAKERAKAEVLARILSPNGDFMGPGLVVSVNDANIEYDDPTDVMEIASLWEDPRAPVFVDTNRVGEWDYDFPWWDGPRWLDS